MRLFLYFALRPHRELQEKESLDWAAHLLDGSSRREVHGRYEYQGADIPVGADPTAWARHRGESTRVAAIGAALLVLCMVSLGCGGAAQDRISDMGSGGAVLVELANGGSCIRYSNGSMSCLWADGSFSLLDAQWRRAHYPAIGRFAPAVSLSPPAMRATAQAAATCHH